MYTLLLMGLNQQWRFCWPGGRITGEQKPNGCNKTQSTLARVMGYVEQNDIHTPALTVVESLRFSAHLRLDRNVSKRSESVFVDNVSCALISRASHQNHCSCRGSSPLWAPNNVIKKQP